MTDAEMGPADFFRGVRVLDLTASLAGPWCTRFLTDLGCEVIKIESCEHYDLTRGPSGSEDWRAYARRGTERPYECADTFLKPNRGKLGITLDLKRPEGVEIFEQLLAISDVVVENFAPGQMERFGLGYDRLREVNPEVVYVAMPSLGSTGPERDYVGYGNTVECLSGIAATTGYAGGEPMISEMWFGDPAAGLHGAGAIAMAILHRLETGQGGIVEVPQVEGLACWLGDMFMDYALNGRLREPAGSAGYDPAALEGVYPCKGDDEWVAISVRDPEQAAALARVIDLPFTSVDALRESCDQAKTAIEEWTRGREKREVMRLLQDEGVPAAPVQYNRNLFDDPHLLERRYFEEVSHPYAGTHSYPGASWREDGRRPRSSRPAPMLGEHNRLILEGLLGLTSEQVDTLETQGVIGYRPTSDRWGG